MQGRYDEAEQLTRECEEAARPNDVHSQILWRSTRAKALARGGALEAAERLAREAIEFAAQSDFHLAHADALTDLAEVLELRGEREAATAASEEAARFYELKGNLAQIIERAQARGITVVLAGMEAPPNFGREYATAFHRVYPTLAREYRVALVDNLRQTGKNGFFALEPQF